MPIGNGGEGRGSWGGPGSRVFTSETIVSEIWMPLLAGALLVALATLCVALFVVDSLVLGPWSWAVLFSLALLYGATTLVVHTWRTADDWPAIAGVIALSIGVLVIWFVFGVDWLFAIWPQFEFARWLYRWPAWNKLLLQPIIIAGWGSFSLIGVRLSVEIFDPGWSRRFERDAAIVGARALWPLWGERFPAQGFDKRVADLEAQLAEAEISTRRVQLEITNGHSTTIGDLPDDPAARDFYWAVAHGQSFSTQTAIQCKCRAAFENEIRPTFIDRGWAYWIDPEKPKAGIKLRAEGWQAISKLCQ
jgi:hypothetical protein